MDTVNQRLQKYNITLPALGSNNLAFIPFVIVQNIVYISGQLPMGFGALSEHKGQLGKEFNVEQGKKIAEICAINVIAQIKEACKGNLEKVKKCIKLTVFVNSVANFIEQPAVANGASELINNVFGEKGTHARSAIGVSQLPFGVAAEVEAIFEIEV
jgi:enamine deaminase RidA (YjgF/YER057c/UK114 family)